MNRYALNKRTLSINSDIPYTTIDNWYKRGYEGLKLPTLRKLAEYFHTTLDYWILDEIADPDYGKSSGFQVEFNEMEHIMKYRLLDLHGREMVDFTLLKEWERSTAEKRKEAEIIPMMSENTPNYVNAAHADDYTNAPEELKQLEEDIMDDENF